MRSEATSGGPGRPSNATIRSMIRQGLARCESYPKAPTRIEYMRARVYVMPIDFGGAGAMTTRTRSNCRCSRLRFRRKSADGTHRFHPAYSDKPRAALHLTTRSVAPLLYVARHGDARTGAPEAGSTPLGKKSAAHRHRWNSGGQALCAIRNVAAAAFKLTAKLACRIGRC